MAVNKSYQAFTIKATGYLDRIITDISVSAAYNPQSPPSPIPQMVPARALWDTGATKSGLSSNLIAKLSLVSCGTAQINHGGGTSIAPRYMVNFYLPHKVAAIGILAAEVQTAKDQFDVIVGMDVIDLGDFTISNVSGATWVSFRTPSCQAVDYVAERSGIDPDHKPSRNSPCPCNSGKKYKRCHGAGQ
jgi:hypothetical protein